MFDKKLIVLVGNIGSGKSTMCKRLVEKRYVVVSRDAIRYMIGAGAYTFDPNLEHSVFSAEMAVFEAFADKGLNIVADEVGVDKRMRRSYIQALDFMGIKDTYEKVAVVLPRLSMKESVDRRMNDPHQRKDRKLWEEVWTKFDHRYVEPTKDEGFDRIVKLTPGDLNAPIDWV